MRPCLYVLVFCLLLLSCTGRSPHPNEWRLAFEDSAAQRIGVCGLDGSGLEYITPDSLTAVGPVSDSSRKTVYFIGKSRSLTDGLQAIYAVETDGTYLRKLTDLPLSPLDLQVTPDGGTLVFTGRYPDQDFVRGYQMRVGESGFHAITPASRSALDPSMAPGGLNFVWHDGRRSDTLFVSSLDQILTLPIYEFPYTQVSIRPDGLAFAAVCGEHRRGLCHMLLQDTTRANVREETVLVPESTDVALSHPVFHPDGARICYVRTDMAADGRSTLHIIDRNSLTNTEIPIDIKDPSHPAWVH